MPTVFPELKTLLDTFLGSTIFTTLDLKAGYWQVEMAERKVKPSQPSLVVLLVFINVRLCLLELLMHAATFQRLMHNCLGDLNMTWCVVYLDDIIVFSDNP